MALQNKENYDANQTTHVKLLQTNKQINGFSRDNFLLNLSSPLNSARPTSATPSQTTTISPSSTTSSPSFPDTYGQVNYSPFALSPTIVDDINWNVLQTVDKQLLSHDDIVWMSKLNKELCWNISKLTEIAIVNSSRLKQTNTGPLNPNRLPRKQPFFNANNNSYANINASANGNNHMPMVMNSNGSPNQKFMSTSINKNSNHVYQQYNFNNNNRIFGRILTNSYGLPQHA
jgi:hypothetical protein